MATNSNNIYGLSGIVNTGNTCYMNSAIQALCHNYILTSYLFDCEIEIYKIIKLNARKIFSNVSIFQENNVNSIIPLSLRKKIQNPQYNSSMITEDEEIIIYNHTVTIQLIRLLKAMWGSNCTIIPTSFRKIFTEIRNNFFDGSLQHDAEEAYSSILQKIQEELISSRDYTINLNSRLQLLLHLKNDTENKMKNAISLSHREAIREKYEQKKRSMYIENTILNAYEEIKNYYKNSYCKVTDFFTGFLCSQIICPNCGNISTKFDPYLHISLPITQIQSDYLTLNHCIDDFCKEEKLDESNLWECNSCTKKVCGLKQFWLWNPPQVLVILLKRFNQYTLSKDNRLINCPIKNFDIQTAIHPIQKHGISKTKYHLQSIINHVGSLNSGHYYTYCIDIDSDKWFEFNDSSVREISESNIITPAAYLLYYIREDFYK